jgi:hypothetical protein
MEKSWKSTEFSQFLEEKTPLYVLSPQTSNFSSDQTLLRNFGMGGSDFP